MSLQNAQILLMSKWGERLGDSFDQYRPQSALVPALSGPVIASPKAIFDASLSLAFNAPSKYNDPLFSAIVDPRVVLPGDYLVNATRGIFFVASTEPLKPILSVACNRTVSVSHPNPGAPGDNFYGGDNLGAAVQVINQYPASVLNGTKGQRTETNLPGDVRDPWVQVLLPAISGAIIDAFDLISDDLGRNFVISAAERTNLGWRITAEQAET